MFCSSSGSEGDVEAIRVIRDPSSSLGKGIAYVLFKTRVNFASYSFAWITVTHLISQLVYAMYMNCQLVYSLYAMQSCKSCLEDCSVSNDAIP